MKAQSTMALITKQGDQKFRLL
uniref:Uncharacterized protein n=1 Tax=Rhizophora mucronata TaxID=61149 RepID=A0A2P2PG98_RHIMU